jgi:hypothetical protein
MADQTHVFEVFNSATCGGGPKPDDWKRAVIRKVEFSANATMAVEFSIGKRTLTPQEARECIDEPANSPRRISFTPPLQRYLMEFFLAGHDYKPTPSRAALAKRLGLQ